MIANTAAIASGSAVEVLEEGLVEYVDGWWIHNVDRVGSTNTVAARLPAWDAVRAVTQTSGRGRTGRHWVSDSGGLWLSAVLPCSAGDTKWQYLPLAAGWGIARTLREEFRVEGLRLRWPNDLMVGRKKLAGLLVERFSPDTIVIGVGINVYNTPETADLELAGATVRLADLVDHPGCLKDLTVKVLAGIRYGHTALQTGGMAGIAEDLNSHWTERRLVELSLAGNGPRVYGRFCGIDGQGALRVLTDEGGEATYQSSRVALLRELD